MRNHFSAPERWNMLGKKYFKILDTEFGQENFILKCSGLTDTDLKK